MLQQPKLRFKELTVNRFLYSATKKPLSVDFGIVLDAKRIKSKTSICHETFVKDITDINEAKVVFSSLIA